MPGENQVPLDGGVGERSRLVTLALVLTTLAAATTGYLQAGAIRAHDEADVRAERLGVLAVSTGAANREQTVIQVERRRATREESLQVATNPDSKNESWPLAEVSVVTGQNNTEIAKAQQLDVGCSAREGRCGERPLTVLCPDGHECGEGTEEEPSETRSAAIRYEEGGQWERYRLDAWEQAANAEADSDETRFDYLAAALTMLTVAVFLFGFSLTPHGQAHRGLFLTCATCFAIAGVGWSAYQQIQHYRSPPEASARDFADGEVALEQEHFARAVAQLTRATQQWPTFSAAYGELAIAQYEKGLQESRARKGEPLSPGALGKAVADDRRALATGSESPTVIADLGADLLLLGVETSHARGHGEADRIREIHEARLYSEEAAAHFSRQETKEKRHSGRNLIGAQLTVAEAELALGQQAAQGESCAVTTTMARIKKEMEPQSVVEDATARINLIETDMPRRAGEASRFLNGLEVATKHQGTESCGAPAVGTGPASRRLAKTMLPPS
jgi:hypothetical protein